MPGTVYTVASGKGGVGKTTTSVNLAVALWRAGNAVALVDADIGMANLAAVLDLEPEETLHDVLAGRATVDEAVIEAKDGDLMVLPGSRSLESFADADPNALLAAVEDLTDRADYVIVDTGAGLSYEDVLPLGMADGVVLVTTPDPAAFGDTTKTMEVADLLGAPIRGLVVTRAVPDTNSEAIAAEIGAELLGTIPEDPAVMASTVAGDPLESHAPDSEAAAAYRDFSETLLSGDEAWLEAHASERVDGREQADEADVPASDAATGDSGPDPRSDERDPEEDEPGPPVPEADEAEEEAGTDAGESSEPDVVPGADADESVTDEESSETEEESSEAVEEEGSETVDESSEAVEEGSATDADGTELDAGEPTPDAGESTPDTDRDDAEDSGVEAESADESAGGEAPDGDLDPREPAEIDRPKTFPAGGVPREGKTTAGEVADEADDAADGDQDAVERGVAGEGADGPDDADEGEADADGDEEAADVGDAAESDDGGADGSEREEKRGGLLGWLGRRFS